MYEKAGNIVANVRKLATDMVEEDLKVLDLVEFTEQEIKIRWRNRLPLQCLNK